MQFRGTAYPQETRFASYSRKLRETLFARFSRKKCGIPIFCSVSRTILPILRKNLPVAGSIGFSCSF